MQQHVIFNYKFCKHCFDSSNMSLELLYNVNSCFLHFCSNFFGTQLCSWAQGEQFGPEGLGEEEEQ